MINQIKRMRGEEGFTLVELLVVMVIIALLAAFAIPTFFGQTEKAKQTEADQTLRSAYNAAKAWSVDNEGSFTGLVGKESELEDIEPTLGEADNLEVVSASGANITLRVDYGEGADTKTRQLVVTNDGKPVFSTVSSTP